MTKIRPSQNLANEIFDQRKKPAIRYLVALGGQRQQVHQYLCEQLVGTDIKEPLESINEENLQDLYQCYLSDYIRCIHQVTHKQGDREHWVSSKITFSKLLYNYNSSHR